MQLEIENDALTIQFSRLEELSALKKQLTIPLEAIVSVSGADDGVLPHQFAKVLGTNFPGFRAGIFEKNGNKIFVYAHSDNELLWIKTENYAFVEIILNRETGNAAVMQKLLELKGK